MRKNNGDPAGDEILRRVFDAPRGLVFEVWTKAEHFTRWFGPHTAEVFDCEIDARPGGVIRVAHRFPPDAASHPATKRWSPLAREGAMQVLERLGEHLSPCNHGKRPV